MAWLRLPRWRSAHAASVAEATVVIRAATGGSAPTVDFARAERHAGVCRVGRVEAAGLEALRADGLFRGARSVLVLDANQRQMLVLEAPPVEPAEWAAALRFPVAKALEAEPDEIAFDHAPMPALADNGRPQVLVAATRLAALRELLQALAARGLRPDAVDVVDMAQRNLALARADEPSTGGTVVVGASAREFMVGLVAGGELCVVRNLATPAAFGPDQHDDGIADRLALHLQRTVDLLERQITRFAITRAVIAAEDFAPATLEVLRGALPIASTPVRLADLAPSLAGGDGRRDATLVRLAATALMRTRTPPPARTTARAPTAREAMPA